MCGLLFAAVAALVAQAIADEIAAKTVAVVKPIVGGIAAFAENIPSFGQLLGGIARAAMPEFLVEFVRSFALFLRYLFTGQ